MSTKDKVLLDLEKRKGVPVSGTIIANKLGVSRTAVWKAIRQLKADGYEIAGGSGTMEDPYVIRPRAEKAES